MNRIKINFMSKKYILYYENIDETVRIKRGMYISVWKFISFATTKYVGMKLLE